MNKGFFLVLPIITLAQLVPSESQKFKVKVDEGSQAFSFTTYKNVPLSTEVLGDFEKDGYEIKSGYFYDKEIQPASIQISPSFFPLTSSSYYPLSLEAKIKLAFAKQNFPTSLVILESPIMDQERGVVLDDTNCDKNDCNLAKHGKWKKPETYGLGFSLGKNLFGPFPSFAENEKPFMIRSLSSSNNEAKIVIKVNPAITKRGMNFKGTINYSILPNF